MVCETPTSVRIPPSTLSEYDLLSQQPRRIPNIDSYWASLRSPFRTSVIPKSSGLPPQATVTRAAPTTLSKRTVSPRSEGPAQHPKGPSTRPSTTDSSEWSSDSDTDKSAQREETLLRAPPKPAPPRFRPAPAFSPSPEAAASSVSSGEAKMRSALPPRPPPGFGVYGTLSALLARLTEGEDKDDARPPLQVPERSHPHQPLAPAPEEAEEGQTDIGGPAEGTAPEDGEAAGEEEGESGEDNPDHEGDLAEEKVHAWTPEGQAVAALGPAGLPLLEEYERIEEGRDGKLTIVMEGRVSTKPSDLVQDEWNDHIHFEVSSSEDEGPTGRRRTTAGKPEGEQERPKKGDDEEGPTEMPIIHEGPSTAGASAPSAPAKASAPTPAPAPVPAPTAPAANLPSAKPASALAVMAAAPSPLTQPPSGSPALEAPATSMRVLEGAAPLAAAPQPQRPPEQQDTPAQPFFA